VESTFRTNRGLFELLVMFFGSPIVRRRSDHDGRHLRGAHYRRVVVVYLDDILIFTETIEEHRKITRRVLELLEKNKLYLRPDKCEFERPR